MILNISNAKPKLQQLLEVNFNCKTCKKHKILKYKYFKSNLERFNVFFLVYIPSNYSINTNSDFIKIKYS